MFREIRVEFREKLLCLLVSEDKMDIKTLLYNLREEVSCSVCSNIFTDPKQLPCLHSFCLNCLKQWHRTSRGRDTIRCPNCQALCTVPKTGDLKDLPTSFFLNGLIDVLAIKECKSDHVRCGNCDKKSSESSYCFHCCVFWCEECVTGHNIMRSNKDHRVLALKDFQDKDYEDVLNRPAFCPKEGHKKEELKYFCEKCENAVCQTCVTVDHSGHAMKLIDEEAGRQKIQIKSLVENQRRKLQAKINEVSQLDEDCAKLTQQGENAKRDIQRSAENLMTVIEAKKQNLLAVVEEETATSLELAAKRKAEIEGQITVINSSLEKADKLLTRSTNAEILRLKKPIDTMFEGVDQTEPTDRDPEGLPARLAFIENQKMSDTVRTEEIGSLNVLRESKASRSVSEGKCIEEGVVHHEAQFVFTGANAAERLCFSGSDHVTRDSATAQVKPFQFKPVFSFGKLGSSLEMFNKPWGVAVNARDEIAITDWDNHRVQIFDIDGNFLGSFGRPGKKAGEFSGPKGIAFRDDGNIFVVDRGNNRIQSFNEKGQYAGSFGGKGSLDSQLSNPCGLSVDSDGNIIVADGDNKLVKIFSPNGKFLMKIGKKGTFTYPMHCVQCDSYLIVSDHDEHCIKVFDRDGNFQYKFGKQGGGDGEFKEPICLAVNKSGHLLVCDSGNYRIQVFEINGKFVDKFGTKGSGLGEFDNPWSVAVFSNGRTAVCDFNNHCIQIFE